MQSSIRIGRPLNRFFSCYLKVASLTRTKKGHKREREKGGGLPSMAADYLNSYPRGTATSTRHPPIYERSTLDPTGLPPLHFADETLRLNSATYPTPHMNQRPYADINRHNKHFSEDRWPSEYPSSTQQLHFIPCLPVIEE